MHVTRKSNRVPISLFIKQKQECREIRCMYMYVFKLLLAFKTAAFKTASYQIQTSDCTKNYRYPIVMYLSLKGRKAAFC